MLSLVIIDFVSWRHENQLCVNEMIPRLTRPIQKQINLNQISHVHIRIGQYERINILKLNV